MNGAGTYTVAISIALLTSGVAVAQQATTSNAAPVAGKLIEPMSIRAFNAQLGPVVKDGGKVISFNFSVVGRTGEMIGPYSVHNEKGASFSDNKKITEVMVRLKPGDKVYIEDIRVKDANGHSRNINPIALLMN